MTQQLQGCPSLKAGCRLSPSKDVLLIPEGILRLQGPGARIVEACDGKKTLPEMVQQLLGEFPGADRTKIWDETSAFLLKLAERGVIEFL